MRRVARRFDIDQRGAAAILIAVCFMALLASAAVAVDLGQIYMKTRQLQGVADLAAMASVNGLDPSASASPQAIATATSALNPWPGGILAEAVPGVYTADPSLPAAQRFIAPASSPNAVRVTLHATVPLYFASLITGRSSLTINRTAVAARAQYGAFSIGSGVAALNGGVANALLSAMTGSQVQLSVASYQALASANVDLLNYLPALQTRLNLQAASYDQLLATSEPPSTALSALADTLTASGQTAAAATAQALSAATIGLPQTPLQTVFDLGPYATQDHASSGSGATLNVNAFDLADAVIAAADGSRQLNISLDGVVPGLAKLSLFLAIGQRPSQSPWLTVTDAGQVVVRTAQIRLYLQAGLAPGGLSGATGAALISVPIYLEAGSAQAKLLDLQCPADASAQALDLSVSPSLGSLVLGQVDPSTLNSFSTPESVQPAILINAPLLRATAYSSVAIGSGQTSWQMVRFTQADIAADTMKNVFTNDIAQASVASLISTTSVQVQAAGIGLGLTPGGVSPLLQATLIQAAPSLDAVIIQIESLTGVRLGEADVWANGLRCRGAALVS